MGLGPDLGMDHAQIVQMSAIDWDYDGLVDLLVGVHDMEGYWPDAGTIPHSRLSA